MCVSITTIIKFYYKKRSTALSLHEAVMRNNKRKPSSLYPSQVVLTIFGLVKV